MAQRAKLFLIVVALVLCVSSGCSRYFTCCPPTNTVLTQSEAESISGVRLKLAFEILDAKRSSCAYVNGGTGDDQYSVRLDLHRIKEGDGPSNEEAHRAVAAKYGVDVEKVAGVGDSAFISQDGGDVSLYARKGKFLIQLWTRSVLPPNEAREKLLAVARLVIARLDPIT